MTDTLIAKIKSDIGACSNPKSNIQLNAKGKDANNVDTFEVSGICTLKPYGKPGTQNTVSGTVKSTCNKFQLRWSETGTYGTNSAPRTGTISCTSV
jgi:hypothetical protein